MIVLQIPVDVVPSQIVACVVNGQNCIITLRQLGDRQYFGLSLDNIVVCENVLIQHATKLVCAAYSGFVGDFYVYDLQGQEPPVYTGWGGRWILTYRAD